MNRVLRELARELLGLWRRSLRSRRFGWVQPRRQWALESYKAPNPKLQIPKKFLAPSSKTTALMLDKGSVVAGRPSCP